MTLQDSVFIQKLCLRTGTVCRESAGTLADLSKVLPGYLGMVRARFEGVCC